METKGENRIVAALGYPIWIVALIVLLTDMKQNKFMRLHAVQALGYNIAYWIVLYFGLGFVISVLGLWSLYRLVQLLELAWLVLALYYAYKTYQGETFSIPVISQFTARYAEAGK